jgi:hypothetical protein
LNKSNALPVRFYGDPADVVEQAEMRELGCRACANQHQVLGKVFCTEPRNQQQRKVPHIGDRCRWFILKGN